MGCVALVAVVEPVTGAVVVAAGVVVAGAAVVLPVVVVVVVLALAGLASFLPPPIMALSLSMVTEFLLLLILGRDGKCAECLGGKWKAFGGENGKTTSLLYPLTTEKLPLH